MTGKALLAMALMVGVVWADDQRRTYTIWETEQAPNRGSYFNRKKKDGPYDREKGSWLSTPSPVKPTKFHRYLNTENVDQLNSLEVWS